MLLEGRERFEEEIMIELRKGSSCESGLTGITNFGLNTIHVHAVMFVWKPRRLEC